MDYEQTIRTALNDIASKPDSKDARKKSSDSLMKALEAAYEQGVNSGYAQGVRDGSLQSSGHIAEAFTKGMESGLNLQVSTKEDEE